MAVKPIAAASSLAPEVKADLYADIAAWKKLSDKIASLKAEEETLRLTMATKWFDNPREGVNKIDLEFGKSLQLTHRINRKVDAAALDAAITTGVISPDLSTQVVEYKPGVKVGEWKKLSPGERDCFVGVITEEAGMPGLKIETPKK